jgi:acyl transferase domain-containing protein
MSNLPNGLLSATKLALAIKTIRDQQPDLDILLSQPIAVIGIGCRFPGRVASAEDFWHLLQRGENAISEIPADRWDADNYYSPNQYAEGKMNTRWGGFLEGFDRFDAPFFRISAREASAMDPQQRLALEVIWEALWDAGIAPDQLAGSSTGVFIGIYGTDHARLLLEDSRAIDPYTCAGIAHSMASGRISFMLDLNGPSMTVDTACSSSLVAVHLACQSIRTGSCRLAIVGGVSLKFRPEHYLCLSKLGMTSPDGTCRTFDARANGFVPGEGCGIVLLKPLAEALTEECKIYAVIRGAAVNHNGRTSALTAPSGLAQQQVIRSAIKNARISPGDISYVETHGTGTALGDPIEVEALAETVGNTVSDGRPCALGSVKTNIGHLEAASGIAGFIKACLALHHDEIPPNLHFEQCNPHIDLRGTRFFIPTSPVPWPSSEHRRFAGVSSFGFSGTNAHVVLEEAPRTPTRRVEEAAVDALTYVLPISALTPEACDAFARAWRGFFEGVGRDLLLYEVCRSAAVRRSHYQERLTIASNSPAAMRALLDDYLEGKNSPAITRGRATHGGHEVVFLFCGHARHLSEMGLHLYSRFPVFRMSLDECDHQIRGCAGWSVIDVLSRPESMLHHPSYRQPATFAIEVSLAKLWQSWGLAPAAVLGHSVGEVAAAHVAGVLSLETAARIAVLRGSLVESMTDHERVALICQGPDESANQIGLLEDDVSVIYLNNPQLAVVGGGAASLDALISQLRNRDVETHRTRIDSFLLDSQMRDCCKALFGELGPISQQPMQVPMISTVSGGRVVAADLDADYWARNVSQPVLLGDALRTTAAIGARSFLGIGTQPVLLQSVADCLEWYSDSSTSIGSTERESDPSALILSALSHLYVSGSPIAWDKVYRVHAPPVSLPAYPFQRKSF